MSRYDHLFKERMIGLLAAAKALDGPRTAEETARDAIDLLDRLAADADRMAQKTIRNPAEDQKTAELNPDLEAFIRDHEIDRSQFEEWLGRFYPEVKADGLRRLTKDHARYILDHSEDCLKKFNESTNRGTGADNG